MRHWALLVALMLVGCTPDPQSLAAIQARGTLNVATINGPTTYYLGAHGPQGAQYSLATAFANSLGLKLNLYMVADLPALREELQQGRADIIAADLSPDEFWAGTALASEPYQDIAQLVVMARGSARARGLDELADKRIALPRNSALVAQQATPTGPPLKRGSAGIVFHEKLDAELRRRLATMVSSTKSMAADGLARGAWILEKLAEREATDSAPDVEQFDGTNTKVVPDA